MLISGTPENDVLNGTPDNDEISGLGGDDTINSGLGSDTVDGGAGADLLIVDYSSLSGPGGILSVNNGNDSGYLYANSSSGMDQVVYSNIERLNIIGTAFNDDIATGGGDDTINAGAGNDIISSRAGDDVIQGGAGNDIISGGAGNNRIDGGAGLDILTDADFSTATANLNFKDDGTANNAIALNTGDSVSNIEYFGNLRTGIGNDRITFTTRRQNTIRAGAGNDVINSGLGSDTVDGGAGADVLVVDYSSLSGPGGILSATNGLGSGYFYANSSSGMDQVIYSNVERLNIIGTAFNDDIATNTGNDTINAGAGNDTISGGIGNDVLLGGQGDDQLTGGVGGDQFVFDINAAFTSSIGTDTVTDFVAVNDKIVLDKTTFTALTTSKGALTAEEFAVINQENDAELAAGASSAIIVFNQATGDLFYNANGATEGLGSGGLFAKLTSINSLTAANIVVRA